MTAFNASLSTFLNFTGYGIAAPNLTVAQAYGFSDGRAFNGAVDQGFNVALVLDRVQDPTALLSGDWASRQQALQQAGGNLWNLYGADQTQYQNLYNQLRGGGFTILDSSNSNYITSVEARTIWVSVTTQAQFQTLFSTQLEYSDSAGLAYWNGTLSVPFGANIAGLWIDTSTAPNPSNMSPGINFGLTAGPQSAGNSSTTVPNVQPQVMGQMYNFPLNGQTVQTGTIGLIEPNVGSYLSSTDPLGTQFQSLLTNYLTAMGTSGTGTVAVQGINGQSEASGERSLDVGIVAAVNPNSNLVLYNGSGYNTPAVGNAFASVFTAIQSAVWDTTNNPEVTTNSWGDSQAMAPGSPFYNAYWQLYVDAALRNQTTLIALGDGGSGNQSGNGVTNVEINVTSPYNILVGGSSLSTMSIAANDPTLVNMVVAQAMAGDLQTIWQLIAGGLTSLPSASASGAWLVETVWNEYAVTNNRTFVGGNGSDGDSYLQNNTSSGGVDTTQPVPWYQTAFGLAPTTIAAGTVAAQSGRGVPDVSALAGGNMFYATPNSDMRRVVGEGGTSAATPFWASLITQFNVIFHDQGLPTLGFMTDLLYLAAAVAPGSFNDIVTGNNMSSYREGGDHFGGITPTGYGYYAGPGYDLTSGLGSPNGLLLARALTAVGHEQFWFDQVPDVIDTNGLGGWKSGTDQTVMVQTMSGAGLSIGLTEGIDSYGFSSAGTAAFAWTSRMAQQSLQDNFGQALAIMFDKQGQGTLSQSALSFGESLAVSINGTNAQAMQATLTADFGFADFMTSQGAVRVARPVVVAETAGGASDQVAIVRMRQVGQDSLSVTFYKVDDYNGSIGNLHPGDAGYAAAAQVRAYQTSAGVTAVQGPGYGNYGETALLHINAGDLIAQKLTDNTTGATYWGFAQANEKVAGQSVGHLWQYGLNTVGWEDTYGGGDHDFNDVVVQLDFTSATGHAWLV
jgi:hypothetical protein